MFYLVEIWKVRERRIFERGGLPISRLKHLFKMFMIARHNSARFTLVSFMVLGEISCNAIA